MAQPDVITRCRRAKQQAKKYKRLMHGELPPDPTWSESWVDEHGTLCGWSHTKPRELRRGGRAHRSPRRRRGAGRPAGTRRRCTRSSAASGDSGSSDSDEPGEARHHPTAAVAR